ncbi:MAG: GTP-binding protein [Thiolinea sp.]
MLDLIEFRSDRLIRLANGCICCTLGGSLAEQLSELARQPFPIEQVVIEASGIASARKLVELARASRRYCLHEVVCLVDAQAAQVNSVDPLTADIWRDQIAAATLLRINRAGRERTDITRQLQAINPTAALHFDGFQENPLGLVSPRVMTPGGKIASQSFVFKQPVPAQRIDRLLQTYSATLLRAKGCLQVAEVQGKSMILQFSSGRSRWFRNTRPATQSALVCIGRDGPQFQQLCRELSGLTHPVTTAP